jgi:hypothetical protein
MLAELEFARWLVHGDVLRRPDIVDDAAALLEALADGLRENDLSVIAARGEGVDSALDALDRVPETAATGINTSMQTDAYNPADLMPEERLPEDEDDQDAPVGDATEDLSEVAASGLMPSDPDSSLPERADGSKTDPDDEHDPADEAQRAARAALHRWTNSSSE